MAEDVVAAYAGALFIRTESELKRPVVLLSGERTNVFGVLEKHFCETALPPSERFWRAVRGRWTPSLETWRPRVNGVQLKVLAGARLPESEEEWAALRSALVGVRSHLRSDSSVDLLLSDLKDFVAMVVSWWENRKKTENGSTAVGLQLMKRAASAGMLLAPFSLPSGKRPCLEYMHLAAAAHHDQLLHHPPGPLPFPVTGGGCGGGGGAGAHGGTYYATPEIVSVPLLADGGSGQLPPLRREGGVAGAPVFEELPQHNRNPAVHGGGGFLQQLATNSEAAMFGELFSGGGGPPATAAAAAGRGSQSPREQLQQGAGRRDGSGVLPPLANGGGGYYPQSPHDRREGSAENKEPAPPLKGSPPAAAAAAGGGSSADSGKRAVALNVGGFAFLTTAATLAAVEGSYFCKLARQAGGRNASGTAEFFIDRSGKVFEYVLDYLRARRFTDPAPSALPREERALELLAREADFYQLPELAARSRAALAQLQQPAQQPAVAADETPSDVPANAALEGSVRCGQLLGSMAAGPQLARISGSGSPAQVLDAVFLETGFQPAAALGEAQAMLLQKLNASIQAKQGEGFAVVDFKCGTEREGALRNLHYHVLLRKAA